MRIKYIGKKEFMPDLVSASGKAWNGYGDVQEVTDEQAKKLLIHDDEFAIDEDAQLPDQLKDEEGDQDSSDQPVVNTNLIDDKQNSIAEITAEKIKALGKNELIELANNHLIEINSNAPVVAIRKQLIAALIKQ